MHRLTPVVNMILLINVALFGAQYFGGLDLSGALGLPHISSTLFRPYQLLTHLFVHANFRHLLINMLVVFSFGPVLEHTLTSKRFAVFYIAAGLGAAAMYAGIHAWEMSSAETLCKDYLNHPDPKSFHAYLSHFPRSIYQAFYQFAQAFSNHADDPAYIEESKSIVKELYTFKADRPVLGASGATFGILTAFAILFPSAEVLVYAIPIQAKNLIILYTLYEAYAGIQNSPSDSVAHFAHLGGILFGYLFIRFWKQQGCPR